MSLDLVNPDETKVQTLEKDKSKAMQILKTLGLDEAAMESCPRRTVTVLTNISSIVPHEHSYLYQIKLIPWAPNTASVEEIFGPLALDSITVLLEKELAQLLYLNMHMEADFHQLTDDIWYVKCVTNCS